MSEKLRVSFDVGGVLSKYPDRFRRLVQALVASPAVEVHCISDMHPVEKIVRHLALNDIPIPPEHVHSADYSGHGEECKAVLIRELGIDFHVDDFPGYVAHTDCVSLFVWPNPQEPYWHDDWQVDPEDGTFGRRVRPAKETP